MRYKGLILILAGLLLGSLLGFLVMIGGPSYNQPASSRRLPPTVGSPVPEFELADLSDTPITLSNYLGKPVVINFWATWCEPCKEEMPLLEAYSNQFADRVVILGVNSGEEIDLVSEFVEIQGISFPILLDLDGTVSDLYYVRNFPITFFVDKDGILRAQHIGMLTEEYMTQYMSLIGYQP